MHLEHVNFRLPAKPADCGGEQPRFANQPFGERFVEPRDRFVPVKFNTLGEVFLNRVGDRLDVLARPAGGREHRDGQPLGRGTALAGFGLEPPRESIKDSAGTRVSDCSTDRGIFGIARLPLLQQPVPSGVQVALSLNRFGEHPQLALRQVAEFIATVTGQKRWGVPLFEQRLGQPEAADRRAATASDRFQINLHGKAVSLAGSDRGWGQPPVAGVRAARTLRGRLFGGANDSAVATGCQSSSPKIQPRDPATGWVNPGAQS